MAPCLPKPRWSEPFGVHCCTKSSLLSRPSVLTCESRIQESALVVPCSPAGFVNFCESQEWLFLLSVFRDEKVLEHCLQFYHQHSTKWSCLSQLFHQLKVFVLSEGVDLRPRHGNHVRLVELAKAGDDAAEQAVFSVSVPSLFSSLIPPSAEANGGVQNPYLSRCSRTCAAAWTPNPAAGLCPKWVVKAYLPPVTDKDVHLFSFPVGRRVDLSNF